MQNKSGDIARLEHILKAISEIEKYSQSKTFDDFLNDSMFRFACIKQMEIIGEASNHVSKETQQQFSDIQWAQIIGMRNLFIHEYFGIDSTIAWEIITYDIPDLKIKITQLLQQLQ